MNILLTGGAGFIGSHLAERLLAEGERVVCLDNFDPYYSPAIKKQNIASALTNPNYRLVEGDIREAGVLRRCFSSEKFDAVIHLAAKAGVRPSILNPEAYYDVNVTGTLRLLEAMNSAGIRKLVFASSSSVYGNNPKVPFAETDSVDNPISPYAASKKAGELLCHTYHHLHGFEVYCLRFFTAYGPRQRPDMAIHQFVKKILAGEPVTLFGDGSSRRDYTYVDDVVQGVVAAVRGVKGFEIINLGESKTISLIDLVRTIESALGRKAVIDWKPMQPGDVVQTFADISRAQKLLGYHPSTTIESGVKKFCDWFKGTSHTS